VVDVPGRIGRMHDQTVGFGRVEMEHARFMVIDPHHGVKVMAAH
jgi:hypothetical protein